MKQFKKREENKSLIESKFAKEPVLSIYEKIANGEQEAELLYEDAVCLAMKDIDPAAACHFVVFPRKKIAALSDIGEEHQSLMGHIMKVVAQLAKEQGLTDGYRVVVNNGKHGVQT